MQTRCRLETSPCANTPPPWKQIRASRLWAKTTDLDALGFPQMSLHSFPFVLRRECERTVVVKVSKCLDSAVGVTLLHHFSEGRPCVTRVVCRKDRRVSCDHCEPEPFSAHLLRSFPTRSWWPRLRHLREEVEPACVAVSRKLQQTIHRALVEVSGVPGGRCPWSLCCSRSGCRSRNSSRWSRSCSSTWSFRCCSCCCRWTV